MAAGVFEELLPLFKKHFYLNKKMHNCNKKTTRKCFYYRSTDDRSRTLTVSNARLSLTLVLLRFLIGTLILKDFTVRKRKVYLYKQQNTKSKLT